MKKVYLNSLILLFCFCIIRINAQFPATLFAVSGGGQQQDETHAIAVDPSGNSYVIGETVVFSFTSAPQSTVFISRYNSSGNNQWSLSLGDSMHGRSIAIDAAGNTYITGSFSGLVDFDPSPATATLMSTGTDAYVAKYTSSGSYVWAFKK